MPANCDAQLWSIIDSESTDDEYQDEIDECDFESEDEDIILVDSDVNGDVKYVPDISQKSDILPDDRSGHCYGSGGEEFIVMSVQQRDHIRNGHSYYPWRSANELWISNLIYAEARMSGIAADKLLKGFRDGRMKIADFNINTTKQMHNLMEKADYVLVCI